MRSDRREAFEQLCRDEYAALVRAAYLITGDQEESLDLALRKVLSGSALGHHQGR